MVDRRGGGTVYDLHPNYFAGIGTALLLHWLRAGYTNLCCDVLGSMRVWTANKYPVAR